MPGKVREKLPEPSPPREADSFHVVCICGHLLSGTRRDSFQLARCPKCGAERFVLPRSLLPPLQSGPKPAASAPARQFAVWKYLAFAGAAAIVLMLGVHLAFQNFVAKPVENNDADASNKTDLRSSLQQAREHLALGKFRLAADVLGAEDAGASAGERAAWRQIYREGSLLADLVPTPIEEILGHAAGIAEAEWQADFPHRYRGKSVVFDVLLSRSADGRLAANYSLLAAGESARLEWNELQLFRDWRLEQPQRVIFGVRLARIGLEPPGPAWVVRFQPDSGVLITNKEAIGRCCPPLADAESARVLQEQAERVSKLP